MAKREELRELQARLADRLSQVRTQTAVGASWLAVKISGKNFLLPLSQSGEVVPWSGVEPVPNEQTYSEASVIALNPMMGVNAALFFERLEGLRGTNDFKESGDTPAGAPEFFGALYTAANGETWQELNLQLLANAPEFLDITV